MDIKTDFEFFTWRINPMNAVLEEYMETIWGMIERGDNSVTDLKQRLGNTFNQSNLDRLIEEGIVMYWDERRESLAFTDTGMERAAGLIRSHRLAERLIADVLGGEFEEGACEFEHINNPALVDSICTMLGHPRECPHGLPIPEGECCRKSADVIKRFIVPLTSLEAGMSAVIAYVYSKNDGQLHIMEGMQIRPGVEIRLHQKKPAYVIEVEGAHIAIDPGVASNIQVWIDNDGKHDDGFQDRGPHGKPRRRRKWWQV
jgi:DtxR family transcriptional regulator, Mn-dependent transcriptional regulator